MIQKRLEQFIAFFEKSWDCKDLQAPYLMIEEYLYRERCSDEEALWFCYLAATTGHLGTTVRLFKRSNKKPGEVRGAVGMPFKRDWFRGKGDVFERHMGLFRRTHWATSTPMDEFLSSCALVSHLKPGVDHYSWTSVREGFERYGLGCKESSLQWALLLKFVFSVDISTHGALEFKDSREGLDWIGVKGIGDLLNLAPVLKKRSIEFVEIALGNFYRMTRGEYYVGMTIDELQQDAQGSDLIDCRDDLPDYARGEKNNWIGVQVKRKRDFLRDGVI